MTSKFYILTIAFILCSLTIQANLLENTPIKNTANLAIPFSFQTQSNIATNAIDNSEISKILVKTFALQGKSEVTVNLNGKVEIKEWGENTMRIHTNITIQNSTVHMIKYLMSNGRYNLTTTPQNGFLEIDASNGKAPVIINKNGDTLDETVTYTIFVPKGVQVKILNEDIINSSSPTGK